MIDNARMVGLLEKILEEMQDANENLAFQNQLLVEIHDTTGACGKPSPITEEIKRFTARKLAEGERRRELRKQMQSFGG